MNALYPTFQKNVFCGQDKRLEDGEGNKIFKALILENVDRYHSDQTKVSKMKMTEQILEEFKIRSNGGQFFNWDNDQLDWVLCNDGKARDKISHALRYQIRHQRRDRRPRLERTNSLPNHRSNGNDTKVTRTRPRAGSFDSCPAKIETGLSQELCDNTKHGNSTKDDLDLSIKTDPLFEYDEMVLTGELDDFYQNKTFCEYNDPKDMHIFMDVYTCEMFTETTSKPMKNR
jgi:hypothetical protein